MSIWIINPIGAKDDLSRTVGWCSNLNGTDTPHSQTDSECEQTKTLGWILFYSEQNKIFNIWALMKLIYQFLSKEFYALMGLTRKAFSSDPRQLNFWGSERWKTKEGEEKSQGTSWEDQVYQGNQMEWSPVPKVQVQSTNHLLNARSVIVIHNCAAVKNRWDPL